MAYATVNYTTNGVSASFPITFPYLAPADVSVVLSLVPLVLNTDYTISGGKVVINYIPTGGQALTVKRATQSNARLVAFQDASVLTQADLELNDNQLFYLIQEALDASSVVYSMSNAANIAVAAAAQAQASAMAAAVSHSGEFYADNTGTPDAILVDYPTAPNVLTDGYRLTIGMPAVNTTAAPTVTVSLGGIAQPPRGFVKANAAGWATLVAGDLQGDVDIRYDLPNTRWIVMNPAKPVVFTATGATDPVPLAQVQALDAALSNSIARFATYAQLYKPLVQAVPANVPTRIGAWSATKLSGVSAPVSGGAQVTATGDYHIRGVVNATAATAINCTVMLYINGTVAWYGDTIWTTASGWLSATVDCICALAANDIVDIYVLTAQGCTIPAWSGGLGGGSAQLNIRRLS